MTYPWKPNPTGMLPAASDVHFARAAARLGTDSATIRAVWKVESNGRPFRRDETLERRFEPHHFPKKHWGDIGFSVRPGEAEWRASVRLSSDRMAEAAYHIDPEAMMRASSWGAPQIMGFNHRDAGFHSAAEMVAAMVHGEAAQLDAFVTLIERWGLAPALRARDWTTFARRYNGPGQVAHYAGLLDRAFRVTSVDKHAATLESSVRNETKRPSRVVLRMGSEGASVRELQTALGIDVDGVFGSQTEKAVRDFQRAHRLAADGVVGDKTWSALDAMTPVAPALQPASVSPVPSAVASAVATGAGATAIVADDPQTIFISGLAAVIAAIAAVWTGRAVR